MLGFLYLSIIISVLISIALQFLCISYHLSIIGFYYWKGLRRDYVLALHKSFELLVIIIH